MHSLPLRQERTVQGQRYNPKSLICLDPCSKHYPSQPDSQTEEDSSLSLSRCFSFKVTYGALIAGTVFPLSSLVLSALLKGKRQNCRSAVTHEVK